MTGNPAATTRQIVDKLKGVETLITWQQQVIGDAIRRLEGEGAGAFADEPASGFGEWLLDGETDGVRPGRDESSPADGT